MKSITGIFVVVFSVITCLTAYSETIIVSVYGKKFELQIGDVKTLAERTGTQEKDIIKRYHAYKNKNYEFVQSLKYLQDSLNLDDWLLIKIIDEVREKINGKSPAMLKWFLFSELDYRVKLASIDNEIHLFVESDQNLLNVVRNGRFYCMDCDRTSKNSMVKFYQFNPNKNNQRIFKFALTDINVFEKQNFNGFNKSFDLGNSDSIEISFSPDILNLLTEFPDYNMMATFNCPFSNETSKLISRLQSMTINFSDTAVVNFVMAFICRNSAYELDQKNSGIDEDWMPPELLLFSGKGDCEDRAGFLFYVLKNLLKSSIVLIHFPADDHVNIGISFTNTYGNPDFIYKGKAFFVCEATTSNGYIPVGKYRMAKSSQYKIIGEYFPNIN